MMMAKVVGTVVPNVLADGVRSARWLLVDRCDPSGKRTGDMHIARDMVNAGPEEMVLLCQGSAARQTMDTLDQPMDAIIVAIVDLIDQHGETVYSK